MVFGVGFMVGVFGYLYGIDIFNTVLLAMAAGAVLGFLEGMEKKE